MAEWCRQEASDTLLRVKAIPGARREGIAGLLGDRLKVRVSSPPEAGRANEAICALLARTLGVTLRSVEIESGASRPEKVVRLRGVGVELVRSLAGA